MRKTVNGRHTDDEASTDRRSGAGKMRLHLPSPVTVLSFYEIKKKKKKRKREKNIGPCSARRVSNI